MNIRLVVVWLCGLVVLVSCSKDDDPSAPNTPEGNFEELWKQFDQRYSHFESKQVDWQGRYEFYRPGIAETTSDAVLFQSMSDMLAELKDPHITLSGNGRLFRYDYMKGRRRNYPGLGAIFSKYLRGYERLGTIGFATVGNNIGYVVLDKFAGNADQFEFIDEVIRRMNGKKALIIDLRDNGGGDDRNASIVSSRFVNEKKLVRYVRWRNGPAHSDFTDFIPSYLEMSGPAPYFGRVVVLTNRAVASSAETFVLQMKTMPNVMTVGDTTNGSSGNPLSLTLPNGWSYQVPQWIEYTRDKVPFEGVGLPPDVPVWITAEDQQAGVDTILETALRLLEN